MGQETLQPGDVDELLAMSIAALNAEIVHDFADASDACLLEDAREFVAALTDPLHARLVTATAKAQLQASALILSLLDYGDGRQDDGAGSAAFCDYARAQLTQLVAAVEHDPQATATWPTGALPSRGGPHQQLFGWRYRLFETGTAALAVSVDAAQIPPAVTSALAGLYGTRLGWADGYVLHLAWHVNSSPELLDALCTGLPYVIRRAGMEREEVIERLQTAGNRIAKSFEAVQNPGPASTARLRRLMVARPTNLPMVTVSEFAEGLAAGLAARHGAAPAVLAPAAARIATEIEQIPAVEYELHQAADRVRFLIAVLQPCDGEAETVAGMRAAALGALVAGDLTQAREAIGAICQALRDTAARQPADVPAAHNYADALEVVALVHDLQSGPEQAGAAVFDALRALQNTSAAALPVMLLLLDAYTRQAVYGRDPAVIDYAVEIAGLCQKAAVAQTNTTALLRALIARARLWRVVDRKGRPNANAIVDALEAQLAAAVSDLDPEWISRGYQALAELMIERSGGKPGPLTEAAAAAFQAALEVDGSNRSEREIAELRSDYCDVLTQLARKDKDKDAALAKEAVVQATLASQRLDQATNPVFWADLHARLGAAHEVICELPDGRLHADDALEAMDIAHDIYVTLALFEPWLVLQRRRAELLLLTGKRKRSHRLLDQAITVREEIHIAMRDCGDPTLVRSAKAKLAEALETHALRSHSVGCLRQAVSVLAAAVALAAEAGDASAQSNLRHSMGKMLAKLGVTEQSRETLARAIEVFDLAIKARQRDKHPVKWATTTNAKANVLAALAVETEDETKRQAAFEMQEEALAVATAESDKRLMKVVKRDMNRNRELA